MNDTITAISTALGIGAISIIRVSGDNAIEIVNKITKYKKIINSLSHTINYDYIVDGKKLIDEVLITVMKAPKTFTKEDVVEINCHGGIVTTNKILELLLRNGCRLAEPGEFTKRAFLNGRIDLVEAEGIMDLIDAKTSSARELAMNHLNGNVSKIIINLRKEIFDILGNIEVNIDYPEYYDIEIMTIDKIKEQMKNMEPKVIKIIKDSENGKIIKEGINVALIGRPNVGKSSLLNRLLDTNKAIVTEIAGTTRDCIEGQVILDDVVLNIIDTAGIRKTSDIVESIGVTRSIEAIEKSDLILFLVNNNELLTSDDKLILEKINNKPHIIVINKKDLESNIDIKKITDKNIIYISALNNEGIDELKNKIKEIFYLEEIETSDLTYLTNANSIAIMHKVLDDIKSIKENLENNMPIDMIEIDLKNIWNLLGNIIGANYDEELLDNLFSNFCLGK